MQLDRNGQLAQTLLDVTAFRARRSNCVILPANDNGLMFTPALHEPSSQFPERPFYLSPHRSLHLFTTRVEISLGEGKKYGYVRSQLSDPARIFRYEHNGIVRFADRAACPLVARTLPVSLVHLYDGVAGVAF